MFFSNIMVQMLLAWYHFRSKIVFKVYFLMYLPYMACITFIRTSKLWRCHKPWHQATHVPHVITKSIMSLLPRRWMQTTVQFGCEVVWGCHQAHDLGWVEYLFHSCSIKIIHQRHYNFQKDWAWYLWSHDFNPFHSTALPPTLLPCKVSATRRAMRRSMNLAQQRNIQHTICLHLHTLKVVMKYDEIM